MPYVLIYTSSGTVIFYAKCLRHWNDLVEIKMVIPVFILYDVLLAESLKRLFGTSNLE